MPASSTSCIRAARQALADRPREIHIDAQLTAKQLATAAGWHRTKVSKLEYAVTAPEAARASIAGDLRKAREVSARVTRLNVVFRREDCETRLEHENCGRWSRRVRRVVMPGQSMRFRDSSLIGAGVGSTVKLRNRIEEAQAWMHPNSSS